MCHYRRHRGGFTLAEAMIATVVLAIAAAGLLLPLTSGATVRAEGARRTLGAKLGSELMERIMRLDAEQMVAVYDGYEETEGFIIDGGGMMVMDPAYARYARKATCEDVYVSQESEGVPARFVLVTVRVLYAGNEIVAIRRLVSK